MRSIFLILASLFYGAAYSQQSSAFTHITTEDGSGLASNVVRSIYQDHKGFMWVGTANGLQRFDGSKFIQFVASGDRMPHSAIITILPVDNVKLFLVTDNPREFGVFDPVRFN